MPTVTGILEQVKENKSNWERMNRRADALKMGKSFDVLHLPLDLEDATAEDEEEES